ncbi:hypothetical protein AN396_12290 [Candidatus Epulonipiscium fishelsonii]|uniref:Uncharacterized protein n=1 Tax=Candidatus Epulonipiscium fishelsonii TaxID=77094 RepID=A0ACC8X7N4_9FIRM|nr:hypothetical protein AN396_12290 [Epulopiscium sp. SCG-B11WGA-EpuloA1]
MKLSQKMHIIICVNSELSPEILHLIRQNVIAKLYENNYNVTYIIKDLSGKDRVVIATKYN